MPRPEDDSALELMADFGKLTHGAVDHLNAMRKEAIFAEGTVPARFKTLAAMLWAIAARCEPCAEFYVGEAVRLGATEAEIGEVLALASAMGGCVGEMWALKAYKAYKGMAKTEAQGCCCGPA
jgi:AhpD family alkylhydroperoxidase